MVARAPSTPSVPSPTLLRLDHPAEHLVEARAQTQHKLELLDRYFKSWCSILANAHGHNFCVSDLWLIDAFAGGGTHLSEANPDGQVFGTPLLATRAARLTQRSCPDVRVHVRAIDLDCDRARELDLRLRAFVGVPPAGVDVRVVQGSFEDRAREVQSEIDQAGHPHSERSGGGHHHRSLWLLDPYGWKDIPHAAVAALGPDSEVVINIDVGGFRRLAGGAGSSSPSALRDREILNAAFGDQSWARVASSSPSVIAQRYADTFTAYRHRTVYPLRSSATQDRWIVHLANSSRAVTAFASDHGTSLRVGTVIAGEAMTGPQRRIAAEVFWRQFQGESLTVEEMHATGSGYSRQQIRTICNAAEDSGFGRLETASGQMEWFETRVVQPDLTLGL